MEKSEEKRMLEAKFTAITKDTAAKQIELYLLGFRNGVEAATEAKAEKQTEKEPA